MRKIYGILSNMEKRIKREYGNFEKRNAYMKYNDQIIKGEDIVYTIDDGNTVVARWSPIMNIGVIVFESKIKTIKRK